MFKPEVKILQPDERISDCQKYQHALGRHWNPKYPSLSELMAEHDINGDHEALKKVRNEIATREAQRLKKLDKNPL